MAQLQLQTEKQLSTMSSVQSSQEFKQDLEELKMRHLSLKRIAEIAHKYRLYETLLEAILISSEPPDRILDNQIVLWREILEEEFQRGYGESWQNSFTARIENIARRIPGSNNR